MDLALFEIDDHHQLMDRIACGGDLCLPGPFLECNSLNDLPHTTRETKECKCGTHNGAHPIKTQPSQNDRPPYLGDVLKLDAKQVGWPSARLSISLIT